MAPDSQSTTPPDDALKRTIPAVAERGGSEVTPRTMRDYPLVTPKFEREPDNAPGPFYVVKDLCMLCALPPETAPVNITWSQETFQRSCGETCPRHCRVEKQPETAEELEHVIEAARCSCVAAIRYCGTDPEILERFRAEGLERLCDAL